MIIITVFKVLRVEKITKGWSPGHLKQEVSKIKRVQLRTPIKGGEKAGREFEEKAAECGIRKSSEQFLGGGSEKLPKATESPSKQQGVIGDICKGTFGVAVEDKSSNEADLRANRREGETEYQPFFRGVFL